MKDMKILLEVMLELPSEITTEDEAHQLVEELDYSFIIEEFSEREISQRRLNSEIRGIIKFIK